MDSGLVCIQACQDQRSLTHLVDKAGCVLCTYESQSLLWVPILLPGLRWLDGPVSGSCLLGLYVYSETKLHWSASVSCLYYCGICLHSTRRAEHRLKAAALLLIFENFIIHAVLLVMLCVFSLIFLVWKYSNLFPQVWIVTRRGGQSMRRLVCLLISKHFKSILFVFWLRLSSFFSSFCSFLVWFARHNQHLRDSCSV